MDGCARRMKNNSNITREQPVQNLHQSRRNLKAYSDADFEVGTAVEVIIDPLRIACLSDV
jgi:hypothetical protein